MSEIKATNEPRGPTTLTGKAITLEVTGSGGAGSAELLLNFTDDKGKNESYRMGADIAPQVFAAAATMLTDAIRSGQTIRIVESGEHPGTFTWVHIGNG